MFVPRDEEPLRKRQRIARSCQQCRSRKVKCDQGLPCGSCRRSRDALSCNYRDHVPLRADRPEMDSGNRTAVTVSPSSEASTSHVRTETTGSPAYEKTVRELQERVRRLEDSQVNGRASRDIHAVDHMATTQEMSVEPITPRLRSTPAKVKLFGQSHWMHVAEKVRSEHLPQYYYSSFPCLPHFGPFLHSMSMPCLFRCTMDLYPSTYHSAT